MHTFLPIHRRMSRGIAGALRLIHGVFVSIFYVFNVGTIIYHDIIIGVVVFRDCFSNFSLVSDMASPGAFYGVLLVT